MSYKTKGVRRLLTDLLILKSTVAHMPGMSWKALWNRPRNCKQFCSRLAGIFPFGFGRESIKLTGTGTQPHAVHFCRKLGHTNCRMPAFAHTKGHVDIRCSWFGHSVSKTIAIYLFSILLYSRLSLSRLSIHNSYSSQVTSYFPIQKSETLTG